MVDLLLPFVVLTLLAVIGLQAIERLYYAQEMHKQQEKLITALLAKDATEYSIAVRTEKEPKKGFKENDEVNLSEASDETFDKFIQEQTR